MSMNERLQELVFLALGEVSLCWYPPPIGVFQDTRAKDIGNRLLAEIHALQLVEQQERGQRLIAIRDQAMKELEHATESDWSGILSGALDQMIECYQR